MSTSKKIVWIDDTPGRKQTADDLGATFVDVRNGDLAQKVEELLGGPEPSLIILDHFLDKTATTNPLFHRGSTIAEAIKERWPACPVVGVTAATNVDAIDIRTSLTYDVLYSFLDFAKYLPRIQSLPHDFSMIGKANAKKPSDLVKLLKPPEDEMDRLEDAFPDDLKEFFSQASVASRLYRWINHLVDRPGFLLNDLWSATFLGLTQAGFEKIRGDFKKAIYTGVFARPDEPRWWSSGLSQLLYKRCKPELGEMSWHTGRRLPGIEEQHYSRCHRCRDEYPETVAFLDEASDQERAMHLKCTVLDPRYKRELYFEDIRVMRGK